MVNGCGTTGWKGKLVPDRLWFLSISEACNIHDFMYIVGETLEEKQLADRVFLNNMLRIIDAHGGWYFIQARRRRLAFVYYSAVDSFGGPAFWKDKNKLEEFREVNLGAI